MNIFIWAHNSRKRSSACLWRESHALWTHLDLMSSQILDKKIRLGIPVRNSDFKSLAEFDAFCTTSFGEDWRTAEFHDGKLIYCMNNTQCASDTWTAATSQIQSGGWHTFTYGNIRNGIRFWAHIGMHRTQTFGFIACLMRSGTVKTTLELVIEYLSKWLVKKTFAMPHVLWMRNCNNAIIPYFEKFSTLSLVVF